MKKYTKTQVFYCALTHLFAALVCFLNDIKQNDKTMIRIFFAACFFMIAAMKPAYAYIDIALGSLILQALVGGFFAFLVIWRDWMSKFKNFFKGNGFVSTMPAPETQPDLEK